MAINARTAGILNRLSPDSQSARLGCELMDIWKALETLEARISAGQEFFSRTVRIEPGVNALTILAPADVKQDRRAYPLGFMLALEGDAAWAGGSALRLCDTGGEPIYRFLEIPAGLLVPNTIISLETEGLALDDEFALCLGSRFGEGLALFSVGTFSAGSPARMTVFGYCR